MTQTSTCQAEVAEHPGELMHLVANGLTGHCVSIGLPGRGDEWRLPITCPHAQCTLTVDDNWLVTWEWRPAAGRRADPKQLADLACALLTGQAGPQPRRADGYGRLGITLKGVVGRELVARGLRVGLELYQDAIFFDAEAAIVATVPSSIQDAQVRVTDDGWLSWECDYSPEAAAITGDPAHVARITGWEALAADIVARVTAALAVAQPGPAQRRRLSIMTGTRRVRLWFLQVASGWWRRV